MATDTTTRVTRTFVFTDIEGSTRLWEQHPDAMPSALARHDALLRAAFGRHGGHVFKTVGDAFCVTFESAPAAARASLAAQQALSAESWPDVGTLRVRVALHGGDVQMRDGDYFGEPLNRVARLLSAAHGGQILVGARTAELLRNELPSGCELLDLASHRLKDLQQPEHIYQLCHPDLQRDFPRLRTLQAFANNLPAQQTQLLGRDREVASIRARLAGARLVTLTGPGGCGKTRLAVQVAAETVEEFSDGVWFVDLAPLSAPDLVPQALATVLGVRDAGGGGGMPGEPAMTAVADHIGSRRMLVVLDNCEHVIDACARLAAGLLTGCAGLRILATSREPLAVGAEVVVRVPPLDLAAAVSLFTERSAAAGSEFAPTAAHSASVHEICRRLEGIPLAVELAAARASVLAPGEVLAGLERRIDFLTTRRRDAADRHKTLRAAIEWSYDLLAPGLQAFFADLAVFRGGWAAAAVAGARALDGGTDDTGSALDQLHDLCDCSLVIAAEPDPGQPARRFRMLEMLREYAEEKLRSTGRYDHVAGRHARYFAAYAECFDTSGQSSIAQKNIAVLREDAENLRAAVNWLVEHGDLDGAGRMWVALSPLWQRAGWYREGRMVALRVANVDRQYGGAPAHEALLLQDAGWFSFLAGDYAQAVTFLERSLERATAASDGTRQAAAQANLGVVAQAQGRFADARRRFEEAVSIADRIGDQGIRARTLSDLGWLDIQEGDLAGAETHLHEALRLFQDTGEDIGSAAALCNLGELALRQGAWEAGRSLSARSAALFRQLGDRRGIACTLANRAEAALRMGDSLAARADALESLRISEETGLRYLTPVVMETLAEAAIREGERDDGARLLVSAERLRREDNIPPAPSSCDTEALLAELGADVVAAARASIASASRDELVRMALSLGARHADSEPATENNRA